MKSFIPYSINTSICDTKMEVYWLNVLDIFLIANLSNDKTFKYKKIKVDVLNTTPF